MTPARRSFWSLYILGVLAFGFGRTAEKIMKDSGGLLSRYDCAVLARDNQLRAAFTDEVGLAGGDRAAYGTGAWPEGIADLMEDLEYRQGQGGILR